MKPYVITEDLEILMQKWSKKSGFLCPSHDFFLGLQKCLLDYLKIIFPKIVLIRADELSQRLKEKINQTKGTTVVSIDLIYNNAQYHLQSNRCADLDNMEIIGEAQRPGNLSLSEQIKKLPKDKPLTIVDDGCFSGATLRRIYELILNQGLIIHNIVVGILIDRANNDLVRIYPNVSLQAVYEYGEVVDWLCERDFFIGIPLSGRTAGYKKNGEIVPYNPEISLPYCLPFGDPVATASIPTGKAIEFSRFIIKLSQKLWEGIEKLSGRDILCSDIPRLPKGIQRDKQRFANVLQKAFINLYEEGS